MKRNEEKSTSMAAAHVARTHARCAAALVFARVRAAMPARCALALYRVSSSMLRRAEISAQNASAKSQRDAHRVFACWRMKASAQHAHRAAALRSKRGA